MENNDVSSANNLVVHTISSQRSLMQIRRKGGPNIDPCGSPAREKKKHASREVLISFYKKSLLRSFTNEIKKMKLVQKV